MNFKFSKCDFSKVQGYLTLYFTSKDILVDSFWEEIIFTSNCYEILLNDALIGVCSIYKKHTISSFCLNNEYIKLAQEVFFYAKRLEFVNDALVTTGDELFMSLALDNFSKFENDAYFTRFDNKISSTNIKLSLAIQTQENFINKQTEDFWKKNLSKMIDEKNFYIAYQDDIIVGFGHIEYGIIASDKASIGMYVSNEHRCHGFGTSILLELKNIVINNKKKAIAGCWYLNHNSIKTQLKAGGFSTTRMVKFFNNKL